MCMAADDSHGPRAAAPYGPRAAAPYGPRAAAPYGPRAAAPYGPRAAASARGPPRALRPPVPSADVDATARFVELAHADAPPLDELALLVAAHAYPGLDVAAQQARLDALAAEVREPTLDGVRRALFGTVGFQGNADDYHDPRNSYLNDVLDRLLGIPITLAVVTLEVARRVAVPLDGVSMPGHFLLRDKVDRGLYVDPFAAGRAMDESGARRRFHEIAGPDATFDPAWLRPVGALDIVTRMLTNLRHIHLSRRDADSLLWVLDLRRHLPDVPLSEHRELATLLGTRGRFRDAADVLDDAAARAGGDEADHLAGEAERARARLN